MTESLIDTNVIVYACQPGDARHAKAVEVIAKASTGEMESSVSVQNLAEFARLATEKFAKTISRKECENVVDGLSETIKVFPYNSRTISMALEISEKHGIHFFDALLAATMQENGVGEIITEDENFGKIPWLKTVNPFASE